MTIKEKIKMLQKTGKIVSSLKVPVNKEMLKKYCGICCWNKSGIPGYLNLKDYLVY